MIRLMLSAGCFVLAISAIAFAEDNVIHPGAVWPDNRGRHIQAHGGGIIQLGDTFYWFGEDRSRGLDPAKRFVACYSSKDLAHWTFRKQMAFDDPAHLGKDWVLERPKVYFNAATKKYVMYMHLDSADYRAALAGVATSDAIDGDYGFLKSFRPLGFESRDIGQFIDDDDAAYLIFEDRPNGFHIAKLSDDYLSVAKDVCLIHEHMEGGALVKFDGLYYVLGSALSGWKPNPNRFATAKNLAGPWSRFENIAPPAVNTYGAQSSMLLKIVGSKSTSVILMGDIWKPSAQWDSRYLWMPLEIGAGKMHLAPPVPWKIDVTIGEATLLASQKSSPDPDH